MPVRRTHKIGEVEGEVTTYKEGERVYATMVDEENDLEWTFEHDATKNRATYVVYADGVSLQLWVDKITRKQWEPLGADIQKASKHIVENFGKDFLSLASVKAYLKKNGSVLATDEMP